MAPAVSKSQGFLPPLVAHMVATFVAIAHRLPGKFVVRHWANAQGELSYMWTDHTGKKNLKTQLVWMGVTIVGGKKKLPGTLVPHGPDLKINHP
jgi:hypothetical protein